MEEKISYHENNNVKKHCYYLNDELHNDDNPALIIYHENGKVQEKRYYKNGLLHRDNNPAIEIYNNDEKLITKKYYYDGIQCPKIIIPYITNDNCNICYETSNEMVITICDHIFCKKCINNWINTGSETCPYCRQTI